MKLLVNMTGKEIIEKLKTLDDSVSNFAYHELYDMIPKDFEFNQEEVEKVSQNNKDAYEVYKASGAKYNSEEYKKYAAVTNEYKYKEKIFFESIGLGEIQEVEQVGGEDMGSTWYSIKYFPLHDVYLRVDGYYQSYSGTDFEDWDSAVSIVKPTLKQIIVFE